MKKKHFMMLLMILFALALPTVSVHANTIKSGGVKYYTKGNNIYKKAGKKKAKLIVKTRNPYLCAVNKGKIFYMADLKNGTTKFIGRYVNKNKAKTYFTSPGGDMALQSKNSRYLVLTDGNMDGECTGRLWIFDTKLCKVTKKLTSYPGCPRIIGNYVYYAYYKEGDGDTIYAARCAVNGSVNQLLKVIAFPEAYNVYAPAKITDKYIDIYYANSNYDEFTSRFNY